MTFGNTIRVPISKVRSQLLFQKKFSRTTGLARDIEAIDRNLLRDEYAALVERAPRRAGRGLAYFSDERDGTHSTSGRSGRNEEHLAVALWNLGGSWPRAAGRPFRLLDYQFPLKARRNDEDIGKVDLLAATENGRLVVIELKVAPKSENDRGDTPLDALVQGIRYAAIVEANLSGIARAAKSCFGVEIAEQRPIVQVLAPKAWWIDWLDLKGRARRVAGNWEAELRRFAGDVRAHLDLPIEFMALDDVADFGPNPRKPSLSSAPALYPIRPGERRPFGPALLWCPDGDRP